MDYSNNFSNKSTQTVNISKTYLEKIPIRKDKDFAKLLQNVTIPQAAKIDINSTGAGNGYLRFMDDVVVVGGTSCPLGLTGMVYRGSQRLSKKVREDPERVVRPFDTDAQVR